MIKASAFLTPSGCYCTKCAHEIDPTLHVTRHEHCTNCGQLISSIRRVPVEPYSTVIYAMCAQCQALFVLKPQQHAALTRDMNVYCTSACRNEARAIRNVLRKFAREYIGKKWC